MRLFNPVWHNLGNDAADKGEGMFSLASFQDFFSNHTDWIITKPVRIILILIFAFILARLVRRA